MKSNLFDSHFGMKTAAVLRGHLAELERRKEAMAEEAVGDCAHLGDVENGTRLALSDVWKEQKPEGWQQLHVGGVDGI